MSDRNLSETQENMQANLEKGIFYVVIIPEWNTRPYDLTLLLKTKIPTQMDRKQYE